MSDRIAERWMPQHRESLGVTTKQDREFDLENLSSVLLAVLVTESGSWCFVLYRDLLWSSPLLPTNTCPNNAERGQPKCTYRNVKLRTQWFQVPESMENIPCSTSSSVPKDPEKSFSKTLCLTFEYNSLSIRSVIFLRHHLLTPTKLISHGNVF